MMTRLVTSLAAVACAFALCACGGSKEGPVADACAEIEGQTFLSIQQYECGLGPDGAELCNWTLSFAGGNFDWSFSDINAAGTYTCDGPVVYGSTTDGTEYDGYVDAETGYLTWNQIDYQLAPL